ncbi:hypothetical protein PB2503_07429 [Parvularcula bermudensis HTCC2503]|uniref:Uncharacterized protein n=1 Tax=Parvularcula bermudensis (strain ATCC BAA-594 / HTCC2503 / KCTC 12087) TaxID=314260 RepID=E0TFE2_PARBH|nr:hypothetical protein [Parvularcula bermudensis]ADM09543.1 hypothetical protein PB2503_07429 [Parvularcula bermudensis HTCC2503]
MYNSPIDAMNGSPWPAPGPRERDFTPIALAGISDPLNAYPHSMYWFKNHLYVGTTRANMCALSVSKVKTNIVNWPVKCPENLYDLDMRAQMHRWSGPTGGWEEIGRAPIITGRDGSRVPREIGYRGMAVFQGKSDPEPCLYASTYASARGYGCNILRTVDGYEFNPIPMPKEFGDFVLTLRLLIPFKGKLFTSPTGRSGDPNASNFAAIFSTDDPVKGDWKLCNEPGFGRGSGNLTVFEMLPFGNHLYAGTANLSGYELWRTDAEGEPPYKWERVIEKGAYRGKENQGVASLSVFRNALFVGSGIQHGGIDVPNKTGPAGPELVRVNEDGSWDLIVGMERETPTGEKIKPLSGYGPGFGSFFNGYFWRQGVHNGWLYLGTFNWSLMMSYSSKENWPELFKKFYGHMGHRAIKDQLGGAELYRTCDGENWLPVTTNGFGNPYNYGIRAIHSTPFGICIGTVNPFATEVADIDDNGNLLGYNHNPRGGFELWMADNPSPDRSPLT